MTAIAVFTPDPADPSYAGQWPSGLERLSQALAREGITAAPTTWTDHVEDASGLLAYPLVLPLVIHTRRTALRLPPGVVHEVEVLSDEWVVVAAYCDECQLCVPLHGGKA